ncbi:hypothetical protein CAP35_03365 [Chitinophagaceae bacterium IBVUCB1]|nr:hypothetical protein CAP35_03365 [Chitinophagaceae bacterium IBVUCB1]
MTTAAIRKEVKKYIDKADERSLRLIQAILQAEEVYDWWDDVDKAAKASVKKGLKEAEQGKLTPHKDVMKKYKKWL